MLPKYLRGHVAADAATGVVGLSLPLPRPERETVIGNRQVDLPAPHVTIEGYRRMSAQVIVDGGEATLALEVTNGDPFDEDTPWFSLDSSGALDGSEDPASDMLVAVDLAYRHARVVWSAADGDPDVSVEFLAVC